MQNIRSLKSAAGRMFRSTKEVSRLGHDNLTTGVPGMVSSDEMAFFSESAARYVGQQGAIVDLGCWLGSTSVALARGLLTHDSPNDKRDEKVFGYDRFRWEGWMPADIPHCLYEAGESFLPEARRVVSDYGGGRVELVPADLGLYEWSGGPIKILLVDAMKDEKLAIQIPRTFFPSLLPGSLLIHQDFKHYYTSWIHVLHYQLRQYFRFYRSVRWGTVAFEVLAPIPQDAVARSTEFATMPDDEIDAAFRYSLELVGPAESANIAAAHVTHYIHLKRPDKASDVVELYRPAGLVDKGEFPRALSLLASR